jgi:hypothetical protein
MDQSNGVQYVFALTNMGQIFRGVYDATVAGKIRWAASPEIDFPAGDRWISWCVANDTLYAGIGLGDQPSGNKRTALFRRNDLGENSTWTEVRNWPPAFADASLGLRGLTPLPHPTLPGKQILLGSREHPGVMELIDPFNGYGVTEEFNQRNYFTQLWGSLGGAVTIAGYNNLLPFLHPFTSEKQWMVSLWVNHPSDNQAPFNGSWFLIRDSGGKYRHYQIYDPTNPIPNGQKLRACRTIVASPFALDSNLVYYFGGYDAGGQGQKHNTAWIYKGTFQKNTVSVSPENDTPKVAFSVAPNPFSDIVLLKNSGEHLARFQVLDALGRQLASGEFLTEKEINLRHIMPAGLVFIKISDNTNFQTFKLIKQ